MTARHDHFENERDASTTLQKGGRDARTPLLIEELHASAERLPRPVQYMEVCGTHTVSFYRNGLRSVMPDNIRLISGPGCPVCVTAQRYIDAAIALSREPNVIIATYGDMLRVPGKLGSLEATRAAGAQVRVLTSARTALELAVANPDATIVFLAVGFETTAPATAATLIEAARRNIDNFSALMCHKLVVPAMLTLLHDKDTALDGFLCPGHVSVIIGASAYRPVVDRFAMPCVVAGFEPEQMLRGILQLVRQTLEGKARLENIYQAVVHDDGNPTALRLMKEAFVKETTPWRALGEMPESGLALAPRYERFDALQRFGLLLGEDADDPACRCGEVIQGKVQPIDCPLFGRGCTPMTPIGPCMVSSEGTCAAWYRYNRPANDRAPRVVRPRSPENLEAVS